MKTIKLSVLGTVYYGTEKELNEKALSLGIVLPENRLKNCLEYKSNTLFSVEGSNRKDDLQKMEIVLLSKLLDEVSGENITGDHYNIAVNFYEDIESLRRQLL